MMADAPQFPRVALVGLGLIGSSIARGIMALGLAGELVATDASADVRRRARDIPLADRVTDSSADAVRDADLVIACVPVGAMAAIAEEICSPGLYPGMGRPGFPSDMDAPTLQAFTSRFSTGS